MCLLAAPCRWRQRSVWTVNTKHYRASLFHCRRRLKEHFSNLPTDASTTYNWWVALNWWASGRKSYVTPNTEALRQSQVSPCVVVLDFCYFTFGRMDSEHCVLLLCQRLDVEKEIIELVHSNPTEIRDLPCRVPKDTPRYHFFLYKHSHEGDYLESIGMSLVSVLLLLRVHKVNKHPQGGADTYTWSADIERHWQKVSSSCRLLTPLLLSNIYLWLVCALSWQKIASLCTGGVSSLRGRVGRRGRILYFTIWKSNLQTSRTFYFWIHLFSDLS